MLESILLIAYTINPKGGSEPKIAWNNFKIAQSACNHLHIVTNQNLKETLQEFPEISKSETVTVHYVGTPKVLDLIPKILGEYVRYAFWLREAKNSVKKIYESENLSLAHHVSWGNVAFGTPLCEVDVPYIFGPAGGGTKKISYRFSLQNLSFELTEMLRLIIMKLLSQTAFTSRSLSNAKLVLATNSDSLEYAAKGGAKKFKLLLADSIEDEKILTVRQYPNSMNILWAGRFLRRKAPYDALEAFRKVHAQIPDLTMTMVGNGPLFNEVSKRIESYGLSDVIYLLERVEWDALLKLMSESKCLLFTSLRDSFGSQILEAAACGTPIVMHAGSSALEWITTPAAIYTSTNQESGNVADLANSLFTCVSMNKTDWIEASNAAIKFARSHSTETKSRELTYLYNWASKTL